MEDLSRIIAVVVILLCACDLPLQVLTQDPEGNKGSPVDIKLLQHPNISNVLKYPGCEEFLLKGALPLRDPGSVHGWQGGQWIAPDPVPQPQSWISQSWTEDNFRYFESSSQIASFEVTQHTSKEWGGWTPKSTPEKVLHSVEGQISLGVAYGRNSQVNYTTFESIPPGGEAPPSFYKREGISSDRELLVLLMQGAYVNTEVDQRLCMLGCASRQITSFAEKFDNSSFGNYNHNYTVSTEIDCNFLVKMKYPKHHTQTSRQVEAEVMSLRSEEDPLYIPPMVILGPSPTIHTYVFTKEVSSLISADLISSSEELDSDNFSPATPQHLVNYLGLFYTRKWETTWLPHSLKDSSNNVKVQKRPFTFDAHNLVEPISDISATVSFNNILCRYEESETLGSGVLLVSALMESGVHARLSYDYFRKPYNHYRFSDLVQQKLSSVEGKWDPLSGELCMVGCSAYSTHSLNISTNLDDLTMLKSSKNMSAEVLSKLSTFGCHWKICIHSVLRKYVTVDSPLGAVVSSLHEAGHPHHFQPFRIRNLNLEATPTETGYPTEYRYTRSSQAIHLAKMSFNRSAADADDNPGLMFPAPDMVDEANTTCTTTYAQLVRDLTINQGFALQSNRLGAILLDLSFSHVEFCALADVRRPMGRFGSAAQPKVRYPPETYVKFAARLFMWDRDRELAIHSPIFFLQKQQYAMWDPQVAEGVYDPHTGEMHLLVTVLPGDRGLNLTLPRIGGKVAEVEDRQVYLRIKYAPTSPEMSPMQNYEVKISIESLRKVTDPLYFEPLEFEIRRHMYASEVSPMIDEAHWDDVGEVLMQTVILLSVMRQITYSRRNAGAATPYLSMVMLGVQSLCYLIRSLTFDVLSDYQFAYSFMNFHEFQIATKALSLVSALLFLVLVQQVYESRLRLRVRSRSTNKSLDPPPASETRTFELFFVAFGVVFISSVLNDWIGSSPEVASIIDSSNPKVWVQKFGSNWSKGRYEWWGIGFEIFFSSVQHLYLLPQVIANVLCDLRVKPLSISFILGPTLVYMGSNLHQLYKRFQLLGAGDQLFGVPPMATNRASFITSAIASSSRNWEFGEVVFAMGDLAITLLLCLLAVLSIWQQQRGGRLGWFPCNELPENDGIESNDPLLAHDIDAHDALEGNICEESSMPLVMKSGDLQPV